jgi:hypothetical protein
MPYSDPRDAAAAQRRYRRRLKEKNARQKQAQGVIQGKQSVIPLSRDPVIPRNTAHPLSALRESAIHGTGLKTNEKQSQLPRNQPNVSLDFRKKPVTNRKNERTMFKTALDLFRPFPAGEVASKVCPYCNNTRESSPGTPCSYCAEKKRSSM